MQTKYQTRQKPPKHWILNNIIGNHRGKIDWVLRPTFSLQGETILHDSSFNDEK